MITDYTVFFYNEEEEPQEYDTFSSKRRAEQELRALLRDYPGILDAWIEENYRED